MIVFYNWRQVSDVIGPNQCSPNFSYKLFDLPASEQGLNPLTSVRQELGTVGVGLQS